MILVTMKRVQSENVVVADRILQLNPDAVESLQDLAQGGCRIFMRNGTAAIEVEESVGDIAHGLWEEQYNGDPMSSAMLEQFVTLVRYAGWCVLALGAIGVAMVFLVVLR